MEYLIFILYLVFFAWLVTRTRFFTASGLSKSQLMIIFLLKLVAGIFYGWMGDYYAGTAQMLDTWAYHFDGIKEYQLLSTAPREYLTNLFHNPYPGGFLNFFASNDSYWNDLKTNVFIKLLSIFDIFSFGKYYVNVIFYAYLTFFGPVAIYRVMIHAFPSKKTIILPAVFLVPSFFYWSSGMQKEGLIVTGLALIVYHFYFALVEKKFSLKRISGILIGILILIFLRNFMLVVILPALLAWYLANRNTRKTFLAFASVYIAFTILFFSLRYVDPSLDFPQAVVNKQQAFMSLLYANSTIPIKELKPTVWSFIANTPQAITLSAARPYPSDIKHFFSLAAAIEINIILLMFLCFFIVRTKDDPASNPLIYFCIFFSFSLLLAIGFSVNNLGAIVRYRSIIIPLLVTALAVKIDWNRLFKKISLNG